MARYHDRLFHGLQAIVSTHCLPSGDTIVSYDLTLWMKCMGTGGVSEMPTCQEKIIVFYRCDIISPRQSHDNKSTTKQSILYKSFIQNHIP